MPPAGHGAARPLGAALRELYATLLDIFHSRAELLSRELEIERTRIGRVVLMGAGAFFFLMLGAITLTIFIIVAFWDSQRLVVIGVLSVLYLGLALVLALSAKREAAAATRPFARSVDQLRKDREHFLSRN